MFGLNPWVLLGTAAAFAMTIAFGGVQTYRLQGLQATYDAHLAADAVAVANEQAKDAKAATDAITGVHDAQAKNAVAIKSAVARVMRQCAAKSNVQPASPARGTDAANPAAQDDSSDNDFASDISSDLQVCSDQLDNYAGLQVWARRVTTP
jgi:hypothetical protein